MATGSAIWRALSLFPREARKTGERLHNDEDTGDIDSTGEDDFVAEILDKDWIYLVTISTAGETATSSCTCKKALCGHAYAALLGMLSRNALAQARSLSEKATVADAKPEKKQPLKRWAEEALGRKLKTNEARIVAEVESAFRDYVSSGYLGGSILYTLEGVLDRQLLQVLRPTTPVEFLEMLAYCTDGLPRNPLGFLKNAINFAELEKKVARARRAHEIQEWRSRLIDASFMGREPEPDTVELRLALFEDQACLQWSPQGTDEFKRVRATHVAKLASARYGDARGQMSLEMAVLKQIVIRQEWRDSGSLNYSFKDHAACLSRIFATRALDPLLHLFGKPLIRHEQKLQWAVQEPGADEQDYMIGLKKQDGSLAPQIFGVFGGYYLTSEGLYEGPELSPGNQAFAQSVAVPAEALESVEGAELLTRWELPMPGRMLERIKVEPCVVSIEARLMTSDRGEVCEMRARAAWTKHSQKMWDGNWLDVNPYGVREAEPPPSAPGEKIVVRDTKTMDVVHHVLRRLPLRSVGTRVGVLQYKAGKRFAEEFGDFLRKLPPDVEVKLDGELASLRDEAVAGTVRLDITETEIDWFDLHVVLNVSDTTLTPQEIKLLLAAKGRLVRLEGKGWKRLEYDLTESDNASLAKLGLSAKEFDSEPQRLHALQLGHEAAKRFIKPEQVQRIERRVQDIKTRVNPDLPPGITATLREYQVAGFHFLAYLAENRFGGILADDMGLGKTLETITWLVWLRDEARSKGAQPEPSLVVCPKSVTDNWRVEAERFAPGLRVRVWAANELQRFGSATAEADLHVINYAQLRSLSEVVTKVRWQVAILDEGQYIKNPSSQTAEVARALKASHRLVLTGTPIENKLMDLWSLMAYAMPGMLGSRGGFNRLYDSKSDPFARERLAARVRPFLLRRTKQQVAKDLPDKIEEDLFCEMEGEQLAMYRAELKSAQQMLLAIKTQKELASQQFNVLTSLLRLRQVCCDPRLRMETSTQPGAKLEALMEHIGPLMEEGQKVLVFSQFVQMLGIIREALEKEGVRVFYLAGDTENRGALVDEFNNAEGSAVFLISLKAGGFGLNLTAASYVVLFDPWWNPAVENQAIDRTHRIGQQNKVIAYRLLIKNSVEEKIRALQKSKKALAEDVLGEERFAQSLTLQDLNFLLADS